MSFVLSWSVHPCVRRFFARLCFFCSQGVYGDFPGPHCVVEGGVERIAEAIASPQVCIPQMSTWLAHLGRFLSQF